MPSVENADMYGEDDFLGTYRVVNITDLAEPTHDQLAEMQAKYDMLVEEHEELKRRASEDN